jgi:hypothetical protein
VQPGWTINIPATADPCRRPPGLRELQRWAALALALAARGWPFPAALRTAWQQLYVRAAASAAAGTAEAAAVAQAAFEGHVQPLVQHASGELVLHRPAAWPQPLGTACFAADSVAACMGRDAAVLLHHLAALAAEEQLLAGNGLQAASWLGSSREVWVREAGLAAAAATPASRLAQLLTGRETDTPAAAADADALSLTAACALAAARVFAERCGAATAHRDSRAVHGLLLLSQLQRLLGGEGVGPGRSRALLAASQAAQLVAGVLAHPLLAAAADLQQQLAAEMRLAGADAQLLCVGGMAAEHMLPYTLAAGLREGGGATSASAAAGRLWQQLSRVGGKVAALWHAVQAAVVLQSAAASADDAVADGDATLLQLSCWRHQRPKERARKAAQHPTIDWWYAALIAVQRLEEAVLTPNAAGGAAWDDRTAEKVRLKGCCVCAAAFLSRFTGWCHLPHFHGCAFSVVWLQLRAVQQWRWDLLRLLHDDGDTAQPASLQRSYERLLHGWMRLRKAAAALLAAAEPAGDTREEASGWRDAAARWAAAAGQLDGGAGIDAGQPPAKPLLWKRGGRPLLPRSLPLSEAYCSLLALCDASRVGAAGFAADHRSQPQALAQAGVHLAELDGEGGGRELNAEDRDAVAAAAAAHVAADPALRAALLDGLCLFVSGALLAQQPGGAAAAAGAEAQLGGVLPLLHGRVQSAADAAAAAAAALLATRVLAPAPEDGGDAHMTEGGAGQQEGVLVPVAQLTWGDEAGGGGAGGQLPTALPAELLRYPSCRQLQLQLVALQDAQLSRRQLRLFASDGLLRLLNVGLGGGGGQPPPSLAASLRQMAAAMAGSAASSVADAAPYQLLAWLLEAAGQREGGADAWQRSVVASLAHEAWWRWQQGLWQGASAALPPAHAAAAAPSAQQRWLAAAAGPMRLHIAAGTVLATAVAAAPPTLIADRSARLLQLKLAARQLRAAAVEGQDSGSVAGAEWQAAAGLAAATLAAHLPSIPDAQQRQRLQAGLAWLAAERFSPACPASQRASDGAQLMAAAEKALGGSSHPVLRALLRPVLLPALRALLEGGGAEGAADSRGELALQLSCNSSCLATPSLPAACSFLCTVSGWAGVQHVCWAASLKQRSHPSCPLPSLQNPQRACWRGAACGRCWAWRACTCCCPQRAPTPPPSTAWRGSTPWPCCAASWNRSWRYGGSTPRCRAAPTSLPGSRRWRRAPLSWRRRRSGWSGAVRPAPPRRSTLR